MMKKNILILTICVLLIITLLYIYDAAGQLRTQIAVALSEKPNKEILHTYDYDLEGNITNEYRSGAGDLESMCESRRTLRNAMYYLFSNMLLAARTRNM